MAYVAFTPGTNHTDTGAKTAHKQSATVRSGTHTRRINTPIRIHARIHTPIRGCATRLWRTNTPLRGFRSRANMAQKRQSRPDSGLVVQVKVRQALQVDPRVVIDK